MWLQATEDAAKWPDLDRQAVLIGDHLIRIGRNPCTGRKYSHQVQGIRGRNDKRLLFVISAAFGSKFLNCNRQGKLFADETVNEAAAANLAACFQAAIRGEQSPPWRQIRLAGEKITKNHPVSFE